MRPTEETGLNAKEEAPFGYHFLWYFLQLIFSAPGVMIASIPLWILLHALGLTGDHQTGNFRGFEALVFLSVGVLVGWWNGHRAPLLIVTGRWIWIIPAAFLLPLIVVDAFRANPVPRLSEYMFGWVPDVTTFPLGSIAGYSIGMELSRKKRHLRIMFLAGALSCCLFAMLFRVYEIRSITRLSGVHTVLEKQLPLLEDPQLLCGLRNTARLAVILENRTVVESLGRLACDGDHLVSPDNLPPPVPGRSGPFIMEHVRVLSGPSAGREGWVLQYGLMEVLKR